MSGRALGLLSEYLSVWDHHGDGSPLDRAKEFWLRAVYSSSSAFANALRDDLDTALEAAWVKVRIVGGGIEYEAYFRSLLETELMLLRKARHFSRGAAKTGRAHRRIAVRRRWMATPFGRARRTSVTEMESTRSYSSCTCTVTPVDFLALEVCRTRSGGCSCSCTARMCLCQLLHVYLCDILSDIRAAANNCYSLRSYAALFFTPHRPLSPTASSRSRQTLPCAR